MFKSIIKAMYASFISIVLISIVLAGWTSFVFITQSSKSSEIFNVIRDMYVSQKSVVIDIVDLSKLLIKNTNETIASENIKPLEEYELTIDLEQNSLLDDSSMTEDNGDNPLGIVIEPSLTEVSEENLSLIGDESLVNEVKNFSVNDMDMDMD
tara:strand:- start:979 stop:1437 length:459 start_codon:yes stop_codon:yes gene_type:complete